MIEEFHGQKRTIGAEKFDPLRFHYENVVNLETTHSHFCKMVLVKNRTDLEESIDLKALADLWTYAKKVVNSTLKPNDPRPFPLTASEAFVILMECSYAHSIRFSSKGFNVKVDPTKALAAVKNGLRSPIVKVPDRIFSDWSDALKAGSPKVSLFTTDPPYDHAARIYAHDNPKACGIPPIRQAVELGYRQVLAFNNFDKTFDDEIAAIAAKHGYTVLKAPTNHRYQIDNKNKARPSSQGSLFASEEFKAFDEFPSGEWYWFLSASGVL